MSKIEKQQEKVANLLKLISENPDLEILPLVDTECVGGDEHSWWLSEWGDAKVDYYYCSAERIYTKEWDFEDLVNEFIDNHCDDEEYRVLSLSDENFEKVAEAKVEGYEWTKAILVSIKPN